MGVCSPRPLDTASSASTFTRLTGCVGLAADGVGPRRYTSGQTPASVRTWDRRTEARTGHVVPSTFVDILRLWPPVKGKRCPLTRPSVGTRRPRLRAPAERTLAKRHIVNTFVVLPLCGAAALGPRLCMRLGRKTSAARYSSREEKALREAKRVSALVVLSGFSPAVAKLACFSACRAEVVAPSSCEAGRVEQRLSC